MVLVYQYSMSNTKYKQILRRLGWWYAMSSSPDEELKPKEQSINPDAHNVRVQIVYRLHS